MHGVLTFELDLERVQPTGKHESVADRYEEFEERLGAKFKFLEYMPIKDEWIKGEEGCGKYEACLFECDVTFDISELGYLEIELEDEVHKNIGPYLTALSCLSVKGQVWFPNPPGSNYKPGVYTHAHLAALQVPNTRCILDWDEEKNMWCMNRIWARSPKLLCEFIAVIRSGELIPVRDFSGFPIV